jgi:hypothetical protein
LAQIWRQLFDTPNAPDKHFSSSSGTHRIKWFEHKFYQKCPLTGDKMAEEPTTNNTGLYSRVRGASISVMNANPQLGMWQASGLALARAPTFSELRDREAGGDNIEFNAQGHSIRKAFQEDDGELSLVKSTTRVMEKPMVTIHESTGSAVHHHRSLHDRAHDLMEKKRALKDKHKSDLKEKWWPTMLNGLKAFWRFFRTPSGFLITIYALNIVVSVYQYPLNFGLC